MRAYVIRRIIQLLFLFLALILILFVIFRMLPGNPAAMVLGPAMNPESIATQTKLFGFFLIYLKLA